MRTCLHCNVEKDDTEFYRSKKDATGIQSWCKDCQKTYANNRYKSLATDPEYRKKLNAYQSERLRKIRREQGVPERGVRGVYTGVICNMIKKHHEELKEDPEHLTTEFMQKMLGRKCKK